MLNMGDSPGGPHKTKRRKFANNPTLGGANYRPTYEEQKVRFVTIKKLGDGDLGKISPFVLNKAIVSCAGEPVNIKKIRGGLVMVECFNDSQSTKLLQKLNSVGEIPVEVEPHKTLNSSKGVIRSLDLIDVSESEMLMELASQNVCSVKQITNKRGPTASFILTFNKPQLPACIKAGYLNLVVKPYIPAPLRCYNCLKFGHITGSTDKCKASTPVCRKCCQEGHTSSACTNPPYCINCPEGSKEHEPLDNKCPSFIREKKVKEIQATKKISIFEARKLYREQAAPTFSKSFAQIAASEPGKIQTNFVFRGNNNLIRSLEQNNLPHHNIPESIWSLPPSANEPKRFDKTSLKSRSQPLTIDQAGNSDVIAKAMKSASVQTEDLSSAENPTAEVPTAQPVTPYPPQSQAIEQKPNIIGEPLLSNVGMEVEVSSDRPSSASSGSIQDPRSPPKNRASKILSTSTTGINKNQSQRSTRQISNEPRPQTNKNSKNSSTYRQTSRSPTM